jgi:hypothetical protein
VSNDNVVRLIQPGTFEDQLTEVLRSGACALLVQAVEAEVGEFLAKYADLKTENGRQRLVRHGHLPEREVMTGIGPVAIRQPRVRDRAAAADPARIHDWRDLLLDLKRRGLHVAPELVIADGALGFWKAAGEVWPQTREQRCWVHKTANVLNKLPKSQQPKAKRALHEIWMPETKAQAETAFDAFIDSYALKYEKAADCLAKDRDALLAFYDFPAEHWKHLRTTNPIESAFATVRHRTIRAKGCLSNKTALAMVFKLVEAAQRSWRRLDGHALLPKLILGVKFADGIEFVPKKPASQPAVAA